MEEEKFICPKCGKDNLTRSECSFTFSNIYNKEYLRACRKCDNLRVMNQRKANPEATKLIARRAHIKKTHGIDLTILDQLIKFHGNQCMICKKSPVGRGRGDVLHVDHDHITNEVRGLLCGKCNTAIGSLDENEDIIWNMLEYLKKRKWSKSA